MKPKGKRKSPEPTVGAQMAEGTLESLKGSLDLDDLTMAVTEAGLGNLPPAAEDMHRIREELLHVDTEGRGFEQYFCSTAGNNPEQAVAILKRIGADEQASIMCKAVELLAGGKRWPNLRERRAHFEAFKEPERELFYELEDEWRYAAVHLVDHMQRYSRANQAAAVELIRKLDRLRPPKEQICCSSYWRKRISQREASADQPR